MTGRSAFTIVASLLLLLVILRMPPASAATDDMNLTGLVYLSSGTPLGNTQWANNTSFAVYVDHINNWSSPWRYPPWPQWYTTSVGAYSIVLPASEKDRNWSNGDWYRVEVDASNVFGRPGLLLNVTSNGTGDPGEYTPYGSQNNSIVWSMLDNWQRWDVVIGVAPDLSIDGSEIKLSPAAVVALGTVVTVNATVRNKGSGDASNVAVRFTDGVPPSGTQIGTDRLVPILPVGSFARVEQTWTASPVGMHVLCVAADPDNLISESDETNNMACVPVTVLPLPDLTTVGVNVTPPPPILDRTVVEVNVMVANEGDLDAGGFDVLVFDDSNSNGQPDGGESIGTSPISSLAGHSQTIVLIPWTATPSGNHRMCAYVDPPPGTVSESNETNNVMCIDVLVQPGPVLRPDYVPVSPLPLTTLRVGMSSQISLSIQVLNQGDATAIDDTTVVFYEQSSPPFSSFVLSPLAPAATSSRFTATWTSPAIPGTYLVSVDVDHDNNVTEWDETNNVYTWTLEVVSGPLTSLLTGSPNYTSASTHLTYVRSSTHLDFSVIDQSGLGIRNTTYRIDGGYWMNYTATGQFSLAGEGQHNLEWYSEDYAGNVENASFANLTVDDTPPATTITPATAQVESGTHFTLQATDSGSGVNYTEYTVDGGTWITYTASFTLSEGDHNITYRSVDNLGNLENEKYLDVTVHGPLVPPSVEANYKPLVALAFVIILAVAGYWSSKRRPWKGEKERMAVVKAFMITSMPFVLAEAGTGVVSLLTGELSIPPLTGIGAAVDSSTLLAGVLVAVFVGKMKKEVAKSEA